MTDRAAGVRVFLGMVLHRTKTLYSTGGILASAVHDLLAVAFSVPREVFFQMRPTYGARFPPGLGCRRWT
jgi:hypothetical protein